MKTSTVVFIIFVLNALLAEAALPQGRAAWIYDTPHSPGTFQASLKSYNTASSTLYPINIVFSYGGDMEIDDTLSPSFITYFPDYYQQSAQIYSQIPNVTSVICVIDGASSVLNGLTNAQLKQWADSTASLYCASNVVAGIQIDLEPFSGQASILQFLTYLGQDLTSTQFGCVNAQYPQGRYLSFFLSANRLSPAVYAALGPMGFAVISGYDLSGADAGVASTPVYFAQMLQITIEHAIANGAGAGKFFLGLPAAASYHEFSQYLPAGIAANLVPGYPMWSSSGGNSSYMTAAESMIRQTNLAQSQYYLGPALYTFVTYKAGVDAFMPSNPFSNANEAAWLSVTSLGDVSTSIVPAPTAIPSQTPTSSPTIPPTSDPTVSPSSDSTDVPSESSSFAAEDATAVVVCAGPFYQSQEFSIACPDSAQLIVSVQFASYGTPGGPCGAKWKGKCNANTSVSIITNECMNQNSCSFPVNNAIFGGDPCPGTYKHFGAQVLCAGGKVQSHVSAASHSTYGSFSAIVGMISIIFFAIW